MASKETTSNDESVSDKIDLIQGALRLNAVCALFCAQPETIQVFKEWVKKTKMYPESDWIEPHVLAKASMEGVKHAEAGEQVRNVGRLLNGLLSGTS